MRRHRTVERSRTITVSKPSTKRKGPVAFKRHVNKRSKSNSYARSKRLYFHNLPLGDGRFLTYVPASSPSSSSPLMTEAVVGPPQETAENQAFLVMDHSGGPMVLSSNHNIVLAARSPEESLVFVDLRTLETKSHVESKDEKKAQPTVVHWTWQKHPSDGSGRFLTIDLALLCVKRKEAGDNRVLCLQKPSEDVFNSWWIRVPVIQEDEEEDEEGDEEEAEEGDGEEEEEEED